MISGQVEETGAFAQVSGTTPNSWTISDPGFASETSDTLA
jgi:hypothetical protein